MNSKHLQAIGVARPGEDRCDYQPGAMRCVRRPHPDNPNAHVRFAVLPRAWLDWLAAAGYGIDWRSDVDPPCTLRELAEAWQRLPDPGADTVEEMMWTIEEETGPWPRR